MSFRKISLMYKDIEEYLSRSLVRDTKGVLYKEFLCVISLGIVCEEFFEIIHL
jgi:hypothetical protein